MENIAFSRIHYKELDAANPITTCHFCADPTGFEYNGRLYVYGKKDHEQFRTVGPKGKNTYEFIHSLVCFSTDDLANWTFHGEIPVGKIAPWSLTSWAPSIIYRREQDGLDHFYMYFSNTGFGVGVLTSTSPLGPWESPLDASIVDAYTPGLEDCPNPFDPGVCVDSNGDAYLVFGGGKTPDGTDALPGTARIIKLGKDWISVDSDYVLIPAPYFFEASDLNYINGTFVYTFNNLWEERKNWPCADVEPSSPCSMSYMTTKTPLDSKSWVYRGHYFKNPGEQGLNYSNNHTHICKFRDQWYILYHTLTLQENTPYNGGFRSICIDKLNIDEESVSITLTPGTRHGVEAVGVVQPDDSGVVQIAAGTMACSAEIDFEADADGRVNCAAHGNTNGVRAVSGDAGSWILVRNVDLSRAEVLTAVAGVNAKALVFGENASPTAKAFLELRLDKLTSEPVARLEVQNGEPVASSAKIETSSIDLSKPHDIYLLFSTSGIILQNWKLGPQV